MSDVPGEGSLTRQERRASERRHEQDRLARGQAPAPGAAPAPSAHPAEPAAVTGAQRAVSVAFTRPRRMRRRGGVVLVILLALLMVTVPLGVARVLDRGGSPSTSTTALAADAPIATALHVA